MGKSEDQAKKVLDSKRALERAAVGSRFDAPSYDDRVRYAMDAESRLQATLSPEQSRILQEIRDADARKLADDRQRYDDAMVDRIADRIAAKQGRGPNSQGALTPLGQPGRIVTHTHIACKRCGHERAADDQSDAEFPNAGGCGGTVGLSHDFYGSRTVVEEVPALEAHHAYHIPGTVAFPA